MSRFQKIFFASVLVIVGFSVAKFLGQPVLPKQVAQALQAPRFLTPVGDQPVAWDVGSAQITTGVRLLPDMSAARSGVPAASDVAVAPEPPRLGNAIAPVAATSENADTSAPPRMLDFGPVTSTPIGESGASRARLRNEAPRSVGIDPQSPAAIHRAPPVDVAGSSPYKVPDTMPASTNPWIAPQLMNAGYADRGSSQQNAIPASYVMPGNQTPESQFAPPPWPVPEEAPEPKTHIVSDGDSLERLATRYLADPKRSREIFELNRDLLTSPDLLPIGTELKIPDRVVTNSWDRRSYQPSPIAAQSAREIARPSVAPAQPSAVPQGIIPRAQLAAPVMVQ